MDGVLRPVEFRTIISGDAGNAGPQFSPDGQRIAFMSDRSGPWQIWMSNADGSDPKQVSFTDSGGTPRWSPDGRSIAFDAPLDGGTYVFVAPIDNLEVPGRWRRVASRAFRATESSSISPPTGPGIGRCGKFP